MLVGAIRHSQSQAADCSQGCLIKNRVYFDKLNNSWSAYSPKCIGQCALCIQVKDVHFESRVGELSALCAIRTRSQSMKIECA